MIHNLLAVEYGGGRTNIAAALDIIRNQVFRSDQGDRLTAPNLVVMFTDGSSNIRWVVRLLFFGGVGGGGGGGEDVGEGICVQWILIVTIRQELY